MIFYTGDIHGIPNRIVRFCKQMNLTVADTIIILGDVGANYDLGKHDKKVKVALNKLEPTIFCIHGNHEIRPATIHSYNEKRWCGGTVWAEDEFPNILFAKDGEIFSIEGMKHLVIGGAYSVDKHFRLARGDGWWEDEQPTEDTKRRVERQINSHKPDIILSHTCPHKYEPVEMFLPCIDQSKVDKSTEEWLDHIESIADYKAWFCGHWHTNKRIDKIHFLFDSFESSEQFKGENEE